MRDGPAEFLGRDLLVGHGLDDVGPGDEHIRRILDHEDEVGHRGRVHGAAGTRAHDERNLRDDARSEHVALEYVGVTAERHDAFLDARAARVVEADDGCTDLHRLVEELAYFLGVGFGQGPAEYGEVLAEDEHHAAVYRAVPRDDAVAEDLVVFHAEVGAAMLDERIPFLETVLVEQELDALAGRQLAAGVLGVDALLPAAECRRRAFPGELSDDVFHAAALFSVILSSTSRAAPTMFVPGP